VRHPERLFFLLIRAFGQFPQAAAKLLQDGAVVIGYHALPGLPAVYHQVAALALVDAVCAYEFINVHVFHGSFLSHGRKAAPDGKERRA